MDSNSRFMYDNVAPSFENLTHFMITQIPYHYTSISTNIITYDTTWEGNFCEFGLDID